MKTSKRNTIWIAATGMVGLLPQAYAQRAERESEGTPRTAPGFGEVRVIDLNERQSMEEVRRKVIEAMRDDTSSAAEPSQKGSAAPPWRIGVMLTPIDPGLRAHLELPEEIGMTIAEVVEGSPAEKAGLKAGNIILAAGDQRIVSLDGLREAVQAAGKSDRPVMLATLQKGEKRMVKVTPAGPEKPARPELRTPRQSRSGGDAFAARIMAEQNRRFEAMNDRMNEMRKTIGKQQQQIDALEKRMSARRPGVAPRTRDDLRESRSRPSNTGRETRAGHGHGDAHADHDDAHAGHADAHAGHNDAHAGHGHGRADEDRD